jgi:hypothetical protein
MLRAIAAFLYLAPAHVFGQVPFPQLPQPITTFAFERYLGQPHEFQAA